ncbi:cupin domain-containing protein [Motilibacter deserti]|uniref:Zinc finger protein n=1 Tax=Motilibacter deserti TaxID=2714956 RepID=A0ABX0GZS2_9ACTN|nr:hypothetical protein [Motilibacter deserti]NHC16511.1 hypothetical protein [Motilibacter deserti]
MSPDDEQQGARAGAHSSGHLGLEYLADLDEGLLDEASAASARGHLAACASCRALQAQLQTVGSLLHGLGPEVEMPADVAARLDAALATAAAEPEGTPDGASVAALPEPSRSPGGRHRAAAPARTPRSRASSGQAPGKRLGALAAAAGVTAVAVLAIGTVLRPGSDSDDDAGSLANAPQSAQLKADSAEQEAAGSADAAAGAAPAPSSAAAGSGPGGAATSASVPPAGQLGRTTSSGTAYTPARVRQLVPRLVSGALPVAAAAAPLSPECSSMLLTTGTILAVDEGTWRGRPAVLVVRRASDGLRASVLTSPCTASSVRTPLLSVLTTG